jgi:peptide/nickel transport system permease protein
MIGFATRRLLQAMIVMLVVALLAFTMFRFVGDPINQMVGIETSIEEREALRERLGLNDPIPVQFARFIGNAVQFDFGTSYQFKQPVSGAVCQTYSGNA